MGTSQPIIHPIHCAIVDLRMVHLAREKTPRVLLIMLEDKRKAILTKRGSVRKSMPHKSRFAMRGSTMGRWALSEESVTRLCCERKLWKNTFEILLKFNFKLMTVLSILCMRLWVPSLDFEITSEFYFRELCLHLPTY